MATSPGDPCGLTLLHEVRHDTQTSVGTRMAGKWDYSLALPSNGEQGNAPSPEPTPQRGFVALREA